MTDPPPRVREPRSARLTLAQSILALEAFAALFASAFLAGLAATGKVGAHPGAIWATGAATALAFIAATGVQARRGGTTLGWILQLPMLAAWFASPAIGVVGAMFVVLWYFALRIGGRIDRERAEYRAAMGDDGGGA